MKRYLILILCITLTTISKLLIQKVQTKKYPVLHAKIYHIGLYRCGTTSVSYMFNKSNEVVHVQFLPYIIDYLNKKINLQTLSYVLKQREKLIDDFDSYGVYFLIYSGFYVDGVKVRRSFVQKGKIEPEWAHKDPNAWNWLRR